MAGRLVALYSTIVGISRTLSGSDAAEDPGRGVRALPSAAPWEPRAGGRCKG